MKQFDFLRAKEIFPGSDVVRRFTFKIMDLRDRSAHFSFLAKDCFERLSPYVAAV